MKKSILLLCVVLAGLLWTVKAASFKADSSEPSVERFVATLRTLNTAEALLFKENKRFAGKQELLSFLRKKDYLKSIPVNIEDDQTVDLKIATDSNWEGYQLELKPATDKGGSPHCKAAAFTDSSGVIYIGNPLGCENAPK